MSNFFVEGILHITEFEGYDHMLFLLAMCSPFTFSDWKKVLWLATAFTLGHSISLALAALDAIRFSSAIIEFCIPVTIIITAVYSLMRREKITAQWASYCTTVIFGIIHGLGFSGYFRMISSGGESFLAELFLFNLGVEVGQLLILIAILCIVAVLTLTSKNIAKHMSKIIALPTLVTALWLAFEKWPF